MTLLPLLLLACSPAPTRDGTVTGPGEDAPTDAGAADGGAADGGAADGGAADGGAEAEDAWVAIVSPTDGATVENPVVFVVEGEGVDRLSLTADGYAVADWRPADDGWTATYSFSGTGYPRDIRLEGLDATGAVLASDAVQITVQPDDTVLDVPYYYQYDNTYEPSATCGITSTAMVLSYWLASDPTPDQLYLEYGKSQAQSPAGIEQIYGWEGLHGDSGTTGTRDRIRAHLDAGRPVVVHGWWTSAGHIAVIVGYDDAGWIVNDPAGDWEVCYGCGAGEQVHYAYGGGWDDAMSTDGDIWWSTADTAPF